MWYVPEFPLTYMGEGMTSSAVEGPVDTPDLHHKQESPNVTEIISRESQPEPERSSPSKVNGHRESLPS